MNRLHFERTRPAKLTLHVLEDRCTPATAVYSAATQSLTVTGAEGDQVVAGPLSTQPPGYIRVSAGTTVFDSSVTGQPVRNLVIRFDGVSAGAITLSRDLRLAGNVVIYGARQTQSLATFAEIRGDFIYRAHTSANDALTFFRYTRIVGDLKLNLRAGDNTVSLRGGYVGGDLAVSGGGGDDRVELVEVQSLRVGRSASFHLGNGKNQVQGMGAYEFAVGESLTYTGGSGWDGFNMGQTETAVRVLRVVGNFTAVLGAGSRANPDIFADNRVSFDNANIGGNLEITGGPDSDSIAVDDLVLGGDFRASMGNGQNNTHLAYFGAHDGLIGGNLVYTGGRNKDGIYVTNLTVYKNVNIKLGDDINNEFQGVFFGRGADAPVNVHGSLTIVGGRGDDPLRLAGVYVGNRMTLETGRGNDKVWLDDVSVIGETSIDLGEGIDVLLVEMNTAIDGLPTDEISNFGGAFKVSAGAGDDEVKLSDDDDDATTSAYFGGKVLLTGGSGSDTLENAGNVFVGGTLEDFELGDALP